MRLVVFGTVAAAVAGFAAYDKYDKNTNYQPVDARISDVSDQCYMEKVERGVLTKTTSTSDLLRCDLAELLTRAHPEVAGLCDQPQDRNPVCLCFSSRWSDARFEPDDVCLPQGPAVARG